MIPSMIRRATQKTQQKLVYNINANPYKARRLWPPDFTKLSEKHQFRLERKYKRRAKLKWARPRWMRAIRIAQMSSILSILVYAVLFLDWNNQGAPEDAPFYTTRTWFWGFIGSIWTKDEMRNRTPEGKGSKESMWDIDHLRKRVPDESNTKKT